MEHIRGSMSFYWNGGWILGFWLFILEENLLER